MDDKTTTQEEWKQTVEWVGIVAGCVVAQDGKYLLVQQKTPKIHGLWNLPAGYVDKGEEAEAAAVRETKEESGYDVALDELINIYHDTTTESVKQIYKAHIVGGKKEVKEDEIMDVQWLSYEEVKTLEQGGKLRARFVFDAISRVESISRLEDGPSTAR